MSLHFAQCEEQNVQMEAFCSLFSLLFLSPSFSFPSFYLSIIQSSMFPCVESKLMPTLVIGLPLSAKRWR